MLQNQTIDEMVKEYNEVENQQRLRLIRIWGAVGSQSNGKGEVHFENGKSWVKLWDKPVSVSMPRDIDSMVFAITDIKLDNQ